MRAAFKRKSRFSLFCERSHFRRNKHGRVAFCAVDGRPETFYQAKSAENSFLQITPERIVKPKSIRIVFAREAKWSFTVECSMDQEHWTQIADATGSESISEITVPLDAKYEGMFFRISFRAKSGLPSPAVSEFEIML